MEKSTADLSDDAVELSARSADFRQEETARGAEAPTATSTGRRASYQPPKAISQRRGVLEAFRREMLEDSTVRDDSTGESAMAYQAAVRTEEVLGLYDRAARRVRGLSGFRDPTLADRRLYRRILRATGETGALLGSLERSVREADEPEASLLAIEGAREAWLRGAAAETVRAWLDRAGRAPLGPERAYSRFRRAQIQFDLVLEDDRLDDAESILREAAGVLGGVEPADFLRERLALWYHVRGEVEGAAGLLAELHDRDALPEDLDDLLAFLQFERGETSSAISHLREADSEHSRWREWSIPVALADPNDGGLERLRRVAETHPEDRTVLAVEQELLERRLHPARGRGESFDRLIDVLNRRLELVDSDRERVGILTRLGELYEEVAGLEEAAADVYREALEIEPDNTAALRALGRLFADQKNWSELAELYEHELVHLSFTDGRWRHHFRVAELYERKLEDLDRALEHYRSTLDERPHYLPALKAAARILTHLERWMELTDLFLSSVSEAATGRQRIYLLDRAAEVAERKLERFDIAIGAWEELLSIEEDNPRAFAALGRLYARTERWEALLELNQREIALIEDDEEAATLHLRNAEICERHLGDLDRAVESYRKALELVPDFLPALEGLGRLYAEDGRWEEIVEMTRGELRELEDGPEVVRQLEALAELFERELDRPGEAAGLHAEIYQRASGGSGRRSRDALVRLHRREGDWSRVVALLEERARQRTGRSRAHAFGRIAIVEEWFRGDRPRAYEFYCRALDDDPANCHWLEGIARTWSNSESSPAEVAAHLEDKVVEPLDSDLLDRYFKIIARLRERATESSAASRAHRLHGNRSSRENRTVLQFAMARTGDRHALSRSRSAQPHHDFEKLAELPRIDFDEDERELLGEYIDRFDDVERRTLLGELPPAEFYEHVGDIDPDSMRLSRDLHHTGQGGELTGGCGERRVSFPLSRLRAVQAEQSEKFRTFKRWTYDEIADRRRRNEIVERLVRLAGMARRVDAIDQAAHVNRQAGIVVFPSLETERDELHPSIRREQLQGAVEESTIEFLYESLRENRQWELFRSCLRAHVTREGLSDDDRVGLFTELAAVCEDKLGDLDGARGAVTHCWQISERPEQLLELVRLDRKAGDLENAIKHQRRHYDVVMRRGGTRAATIVRSGLELAELLLESEERKSEGIDVLEDLREEFPDVEMRDAVLRRLAGAYVDRGEPELAIEALHGFLTVEVTEENADDWRELVRLYDEGLNNPGTAYDLQWRIVEEFPGSERDLERLVGLAYRDDRVEECVDRLEECAENESGADRRTLLFRAGRIAQEDLQLFSEADRLFEQVLDLTDSGSDAEVDALRRRVVCLAGLAGREGEATDVFSEILEYETFDPTVFRAMLQLFDRERAFDRARMTRQVLTALNCDVEQRDVRTKTSPACSFGEEAVEGHLLPDRLDPGVYHLLRQMAPLAEKVCAAELPQKNVLDGTTLTADRHGTMVEALDDAMSAFDTHRYRAQAGDNGPPAPQIFGSGTPDIWLNQHVLSDFESAECRFTAGYAAALGWSGLAPVLELDGRRLWHLVEGTWLRQRGEGFEERVDVESQKMADEIGSPFLAMARRRVVRAAEPVLDELPGATCELWPDAVEEFAARAGLVLCGDLAAAIRCILRFRGWELEFGAPETRDQISRIDLVARLIRFAFSRDYLDARYAVGLSGRPSQLNI